MIGMRLEQATRAVGGALLGDDATFLGVSTDTRANLTGSLFVALRGERFDAHDYANQAAEGKAAALLVERDTGVDRPQIVVPDTLVSLGLLAQAWRGGFSRPLLAITGSNGKTTVKQMVASILRQRGNVHATHGNLNNHIGVPKTLFGLGDGHDYAVVEMGANHAGEIDYLVSLAQPDAALITNAGPAHLEGFGDLDGVAHAKGEIFAGLPEASTAVINFDDPYAPLWREFAGDRRIIGFGLDAQDAEFRGEIISQGLDTAMRIHSPEGPIELRMPLVGRHNAMNALAAAALVSAVGASGEEIKAGLETVENVAGRLKQHQLPELGLHLVDDSYNANPASVRAAIDWLSGLSSGGDESWLALGDMAELGDDAEALHAELGDYARNAGIARLLACGPLSAAASGRFGAAGERCESTDALSERLLELLAGQRTGQTHVLVKGSRSARMERVVEQLIAAKAEERH